MSSASNAPIGADMKYCADCGKVIFRKAEICPGCGCRQISRPAFSLPKMDVDLGKIDFGMFSLRNRHISNYKRIKLYILNILWPGWGNASIGDSRGGTYAKLSIIFFIVSWFTYFIPSFAFFIYCSHQGYQYLLEED